MESYFNVQSSHQELVIEFMEKAGQHMPADPVIPEKAVRRLRAELIFEEAKETIEALGFRLNPSAHLEEIVPEPELKLAEIVDGCLDVNVVSTGTLVACGVPDFILQDEVNRNNLAKFGPGHTYNEHGKLIKPPGHQPPNIDYLLRKMGYEGS